MGKENGLSAKTRNRLQFRVRSDVRRTLARLNLPQNGLAKRCGISSGYMSQLLTGERSAGPQVRARLLKALPDLSFDQMFEEVAS